MEEKPRIIIDERSREDETINAIEDAAVSGDDPSRVLRPERTLEHRLAEIADLCEAAGREPEAEHLRPREGMKKHDLAEYRAGDVGADRGDRALDRLSRTDRRHDRMPAVVPSAEIPADV